MRKVNYAETLTEMKDKKDIIRAASTKTYPQGSIFEAVKELPIEEVLEEVFNVVLKQVGESYTTDDNECPFCGHHDCFFVNPKGNYFNCFSCDTGGDATAFGSITQDIPPYSAALQIMQVMGAEQEDDRSPEDLPTSSARTKQELVDPEPLTPEELARRRVILQEYVNRCVSALWSRPAKVKYQQETRGHTESVLRMFEVGYMPGNLISELIRDGVCTIEDLALLGLVTDRGMSLIAEGCNTYPLYGEAGELVGVCAKDPDGKWFGQQRKHGRLGHAPFFGMQALRAAPAGSAIWVLEGQNDALSMKDKSVDGVVLATLGNLRAEQIAWMAANSNKFQIKTFFDNDHAGDKYRKIVASELHGLVEQYVPFGVGQDPDDFLRGGGDISELVESQRTVGVANESLAVPDGSKELLDQKLECLKTLAALPVTNGKPSDVGVARAMIELANGKYVYVRETATWSEFDGAWHHDRSDAVFRAVVAMGDHLSQCMQAAGGDEVAFLSKAAADLHTVKKITAVMKAAANEKSVLVSAADFDANEDLLGVTNGVVDLSTLTFRTMVPEDYISKSCGVAFDASADCPEFKKFMAQAFAYENPQHTQTMLDYMQWAIGQTLLFKPGRRWVAHLYGPPGSGKSTLVETLSFVLGSYAKAVDPKALAYTAKAGSGPSPEIAKLVGIRLATIPEAGDENTLNDELIKALSGGDTISARFLNKNPIEFRFGGQKWFVGNTRPSSKTNGAAFFRRFRIIPMLNSRPETEQDRFLEARLREEGSGILNYALEGLSKFGLKEPVIPEPMQREMTLYREELDLIGLWIEECCKVGEKYACPTTSLHENYAKFIRGVGGIPLGRTKFQQRMIDRGFVKTRRDNISTLVGIDIEIGLLHNQR